MTTVHQSAPQHNSLSNQAGIDGKTTPRAYFCLPWQRLGWFIVTTFLAGFILNELWEMAQMPAYEETAGRSWISTLRLCSRAAVGDVGIIMGMYAAGTLAAGDPSWGLHCSWNIYATVSVLGLAYAALVEHATLAAGRWSYSELMPMLPWFGAGLWPLLQMTLLPPLTFLFARWWTQRSGTKVGFL